jgi:predicted Zn finger-like uncharacterized protein
MFTSCTECGSRFRLTLDQLTAAQGSVRCGRCHEVFDAYENLEGAEVAPRMREQEAEPEAEAPIQIEEEAAPELDMPMAADDEPVTSAPELKASRRRKAEDLPIDDMFADVGDTGLHGTPTISSDLDEVQADEAEPVGFTYQDEIKPLPDALAGDTPRSYGHVDELHTPPAPRPSRPLLAAFGWLTVLVLALLLLAQLVDVYRQPLSQNPVIGPSLQALYARLGHPLTGPTSASDWDVGALNVTTDPDSAGALSITGSLTNGAGLVQPWPVLRVVLSDRFGEALRSRDFKPADYLPAGQAASSLAPGLSARFRLDIVDPGAEAVGFSLTPCLDVAVGRVCAVASSTD